MDFTVFYTVLSGVITFVAGQIFVKLVLDPVHEAKKTIAQISHCLIEHANVIANPGAPKQERIEDASRQLRRLSSQLQSHLYLVPAYPVTAFIFRLPSKKNLLSAAKSLIGLSNGVHRENAAIYEANAKKAQNICDQLRIFVPEEERWVPLN